MAFDLSRSNRTVPATADRSSTERERYQSG
ncbi:hypothetical protein HALLA_02895 (plasmid) [Halostagnicola larsenii XH-48]|uniref:Uncharacterized protein n=1 Tax=Halostagnicola larsenii XH-48 TaxID=797299 RepID=W0JVK3_9EURY|nr:hypothetical protein HALLA_02895 [Halostagnicola larsenii XH-48]